MKEREQVILTCLNENSDCSAVGKVYQGFDQAAKRRNLTKLVGRYFFIKENKKL